MTKEELKAYILEAVDALDPADLEVLFPPNQQPDLYAVVEELTGLKGAVSKLSGSTLKLNHEIHSLVGQVGMQQEQQTQLMFALQEKEKEEKATEEETLNTDLKNLLVKLLEMDEVFQLAVSGYQALPSPTLFNLNQFKTKLAAWQKGFDITLNRWQKLLQSINLYKTGLVGEDFNPELHEAVAVKHQNDKTNNTILETEQAGFLYKGKVLKQAKVVVNKVKIVKPVAPIDESKLAEEVIAKSSEEPIISDLEVAPMPQKEKPKPKRKKGRGGRRKKRKRKRK